jgi:hypothetical protein
VVRLGASGVANGSPGTGAAAWARISSGASNAAAASEAWTAGFRRIENPVLSL